MAQERLAAVLSVAKLVIEAVGLALDRTKHNFIGQLGCIVMVHSGAIARTLIPSTSVARCAARLFTIIVNLEESHSWCWIHASRAE